MATSSTTKMPKDSAQLQSRPLDLGSKRPSMSARTISSPASPDIPIRKTFAGAGDLGILTPPLSPTRKTSSSNNSTGGYEHLDELKSLCETDCRLSYTTDGIIECPYEIEYIVDQDHQKQSFGRGAWSNVLKGICHSPSRSTPSMMTTPVRKYSKPPLLVAVKTPTTKQSTSVLRNEAKVLSRLREVGNNEEHIAIFHGIIDNDSALVLTAHQLSLEDHIRARGTSVTDLVSPIIGGALVWLDLADRLVSTLDWLHNEALIVHGDIKPGNIVLQVRPDAPAKNKFAFQPLFIDFSSSHRLDTNEITENTLSAVTLEYTAPELLTVAVMQDKSSTATVASDIFSMAVTLLVAATGDLQVYTGFSQFQKRELARQGWDILNNVRSLSARAPRHGVVSRVLERAVLKKDMGRITTSAWNQLIQAITLDVEGQSKL